MKNTSLGVILFLIGTCAQAKTPPASNVIGPSVDEKYQNGCGKPKPVSAYVIPTPQGRLVLPARTVIERNGVSIHRDQEPQAWEEPYSYATAASALSMTLILVVNDDCVDIQVKELFIVLPSGRVVKQRIWTSHWKDGFFISDGRLTYWSEWFCQTEDKEREEGKSYVHAFNPDSLTFERKSVPVEMYCGAKRQPRHIVFKSPSVISRR